MSLNSVLVVDDEQDLLTVMKGMLEREGYRVHDFTDPLAALGHAKDCNDCGIIISDIRMPGMNGIQLVKSLKKLRPDIKVVLMTAFEVNKKEWQTIMPNTEVDAFLTKPFRGLELVRAIERCAPEVNAKSSSTDLHTLLRQ